MEEDQLLPISHVAEILFCPRNFYYRMVENAEERNAHMLQGKWDDEKRAERLSLKRESGLQTRNLHVHSNRLGIAGVLDLLESGDDQHIVEFKKGEYRQNDNDDVQLCAQAMAYEEMTGQPMDFGFVYYHASHRRRKVVLSEELRDLVEQTVHRAREIVKYKIIPEPVNDARCVGCALRDRCLPDEVSFIREQKPEKKLVRPTPGMQLGRVLYLDEAFAYVKREGRHLIVTKNKEVLREVPIDSIDEIVSGINVQWTSQAMALLMNEGIPLSYLTSSGKYIGSIRGPHSKNGLLRIRQFSVFSSPQRWRIAAAFSKGKLQNMRVLMLRNERARSHGDGTNEREPVVKECFKQIETAIKKLDRVQDRDEILGWEGQGTRAYFMLFRRWVREPFHYSGRVRRPATDPVNAMLNLGYGLLRKTVESAIHTVGFDPYIGLLHEPLYGRPALALDVMEEFRPLIVDSIVLRAISQKIVTLEDFELDGVEVRLGDSARKTFYKLYDQRLSQEVTHPLFRYQVTYRRMIELQVRFLAKVLTGELQEYVPFKVR